MSTGKIYLVAEGDDEKGFLTKMAAQYGWDNVEIVILEGKDKLSTFVKSFMRNPPKKIGFMLDADDDYGARLQSFNDIIKRNAPSLRDRSVLFIAAGPGKIGAFEDIVINDIKNDPIFECAERAVKCRGDVGVDDAVGKKMLVQVFIALKIGQGCALGKAFERGILDCRASAYADIRDAFAPLFR